MAERSVPVPYPQSGVASTCRSYEEYCAMFQLEEPESNFGTVLDVAGGASSFTAQLNARGAIAYAADPFYGGPTEDVIAIARFAVTFYFCTRINSDQRSTRKH
jgi:hypothetical protein